MNSATSPSSTYTLYFAGALFDHKQLTGNALLAASIEEQSRGRIKCILPQDLETAEGRASEIRDNDLKQVLQCDLALFNFDGSELDSGTLVEFMFAKMLDIPSVVIRSDFRSAGDQGPEGDHWNLMCSFYPRTEVLRFNAMQLYHTLAPAAALHTERIKKLDEHMAAQIIAALDRAISTPPLIQSSESSAKELYRWASIFPGSLRALCSDEFLHEVISRKRSKGLL